MLAGYLTSQSLKEWKGEQVVTKRVVLALSHFLGIFSHFLGKDYGSHNCDWAGGDHSEEHRPSCCQGFLDLLNDIDVVIALST